MALYEITQKTEFESKVLQSSKVVLVDFWAPWCPPCRAMAPILHAVADDMDAQVDVVKVDIEASADNASLAQDYEVQGIPNMIVFKGGKVVDRFVGMRPAPVLTDDLRKHIG